MFSRKDFYKTFAARQKISQEKAKDLTIAFFDHLNTCIEENDFVWIRGFGTFTRKFYKGHLIGDPRGGGHLMTPDKEKVVFKQENHADLYASVAEDEI